MKPALILSGQTMALGVVRALGAMGVPIILFHYDEERDIAQLSKYVTQRVKAPHPEHAEAQFIDLLLTCSDRFGGGLLIPVSDESLAAVSRNKHLLEPHYVVACTEWDISRRFIDKKYTYALAEKHGVAAPRTFIPKSEEDVISFASGAEFPYLVKPCQSHLFYEVFQRKMVAVASTDQMLEVYRQATAAGLEVMLQEIIPGDDAQVLNYNAYVWGGRSLVEFTAWHVRNAPTFFGSPRVAVSRCIPEVIKPGRKILECMGFYGYACTEFKKDSRDGTYKLIEVNGRHNLSTLLAVRCGINFPWLHYRHLMLGELPEAVDFEKEIYWIDMVRDVGYSAMSLTQERYSPAQYIRPYLKPHQFAVLDWKDIKPFIRRVYFVFSKIVRNGLQYLREGKKKDQMQTKSAESRQIRECFLAPRPKRGEVKNLSTRASGSLHRDVRQKKAEEEIS